jgi:hypothetical protein
LEALVASFYKQHDDIQHILDSLPPNERMHFLSSKKAGNCHLPTTNNSTKTAKFSFPLIIQSNCLAPIACSNQESKKSASINKRQIINRSRIGRDKLMRLFNNHVDLNDHSNTTAMCQNEPSQPYETPSTHRYDQSKSIQVAPPTIAASARAWRYPLSNHVYAVKVVNDIKTISQEYAEWFGSKSNQTSGLVPRLSLEWPKNWSFSNL